MKYYYDKQIDALSIRFNNHPYLESEEVKKGVIFDYDRQGRIIGIEILEASKIFPRGFERSILQNRAAFD